MGRNLHHRIAWSSAACILALAWTVPFAGTPDPASAGPSAPAASPSFLDTLTLLRWGAGALDWTLPDLKNPEGGSHARIPHRRT